MPEHPTPRVVKADSRGRVNVGKEKARRKYKVEFKEDGVVVLTPVQPPRPEAQFTA